MKRHDSKVKGCYLLHLDSHQDHRGSFKELYSHDYYDGEVLQVNLSFSLPGTLRGLHVNNFAKYVTCVKGFIYVVVVDLRPGSESYGQWDAFELEHDTMQVIVPAGCGHGFLALEESLVLYSQGGTYSDDKGSAIHYTSFDIKWPPPEDGQYLMSTKDKNAPKVDTTSSGT